MRIRPREEYLVKAVPTLKDLLPDHPARIRPGEKVDGFDVAPLTDDFLRQYPHYHPINQSVWGVQHVQPPYAQPPRHNRGIKAGRWPAAGFTAGDRKCRGAPAVFPDARLQDDGSLLLGVCFRHAVMGLRSECSHKHDVLPVVSSARFFSLPY